MIYPAELKNSPFDLQELLALENGLKAAVRFAIYENQKRYLEMLKNMVENSGLIFTLKDNKEIHKHPPYNCDYIIYLTKSKNLAEEISEAEKSGDVRKMGEILGYPECCIDFYVNAYGYLSKSMCCLSSFTRTRIKPDFCTNNIFNFASRLTNNIKSFSAFINLNKANEFFKYFLISHVPCSYDCKKSIRMGRDMLKILKAELPQFADEIVSSLKRPFLVFDDFNWIAFDGVVKNRRVIEYENICPVRSLYSDGIFRKGNKIKLSDDRIEIIKDGEAIQTIKRNNEHDGVIIDFS